MIPAKRLPAQPARWQELWRDAISDPRELLELLDLAHRADDSCPTAIPVSRCACRAGSSRACAAAIRPIRCCCRCCRRPRSSAKCPVSRATRSAISTRAPGAACCASTVAGRCLIATGSCAVHCRYCFRRHFPYAEETAAADRWQAAIAELRADASIDEVILSGGDPLSLSTAKLADLTAELATIPHIKQAAHPYAAADRAARARGCRVPGLARRGCRSSASSSCMPITRTKSMRRSPLRAGPCSTSGRRS